MTLSEGVIIGLLKQGVRKYFGILGHGNTDIGEVLRVYSEEGALRFLQCRNEVAMAHAATMLAWAYGETPAVLSSIGPGPLLAYSGSLAAASNGIGVYHLYGDETTHGEGYNMQQVIGGRVNSAGSQISWAAPILSTRLRLCVTPCGAAPRPCTGPISLAPSIFACRSIHSPRQSHRSTSKPCRSGSVLARHCRLTWRPSRTRPCTSVRLHASWSRLEAVHGSPQRRSVPLPKGSEQRSCSRPARMAYCPTITLSTCMSAAARVRSPATTPWSTRNF